MKTIVYALVVTYTPDINELNSLILSLKPQVSRIVVCNNSEDELVLDDKSVLVFNFHDNLGVAKAQNIGMEWAFNNGAEFVLQMDQDSIPNDDMVEELLKAYEELTLKGYNIGLIGPQDFDKNTKEINRARLKKGKKIKNTSCVIVEHTLSSGSIIPKKAYDIVGGMNDELFIDLVDHEFCWRLRKNCFIVARDLKAKLAHRLGYGKKKILCFLYVGVPTPIRHYYAFRNTVFLLNRNYAPLYWKLSSFFKLIFKVLVYPLFLNDGKTRFKYMLLGLKHGIQRRMGRIDV